MTTQDQQTRYFVEFKNSLIVTPLQWVIEEGENNWEVRDGEKVKFDGSRQACINYCKSRINP